MQGAWGFLPSSKGARDASARLFGPPSDFGINIGVVFSELRVKVGVAEMAVGRGEQLQVQIDHLRELEVHGNVGPGHSPSPGWWVVVAHTSSFSHSPGSNVRMS